MNFLTSKGEEGRLNPPCLFVRFVTFCYFLTACSFDKLLFTVEKGQGLYCIHCARGKGCRLIFFLLFFSVEGEGGGG